MLNSVIKSNLDKYNQSEFPSISKMSQDKINSFEKVDNWVQNRTLFNEKTSWTGGKSLDEDELNCSYWGGYSYQDVIPDNAMKNTLKDTMSDLKSDDVYMDIGAGDGLAIHQYREIYPEGANVIGIASTLPLDIERLINEERKDEKFSFFLADFNEFPTESLSSQVSVITDIKGAFRYGLDPASTIKKMGNLLKEGGIAIISFGYGLGIDPPSLIKNEYSCLNSRQKYGTGSNMLLHLWFHTIKGFDLILENMDLEESRKRHSEVMEEPEKYHKYCCGDELMIIRRNNHPIEVEELTPNPTFMKTWSEESKKDWDSFWPRYTWKASNASEALLSKITWLNR